MNSSYNTIVIGSGLTGLLLAHRLARSGQSVALLESRESLGGRYRRQGAQQSFTSTGLEFYPATNENLDVLEWLKSVALVPMQFEVREHRPEVFDEGRWRAFAGFGDSPFASVSDLSYFSHTHEVAITPGLEHLVRAMVEQLPFVPHTMSEVTGLKVVDGQVTEVIVNGDKVLNCERVVFTPHPAQLNALVSGEGLAAKSRTRLAKMQSWTAVTLELKHTPPLVEDSSIRIFMHNAKEFEPVVGRVWGEVSRWLTLVPAERDQDHEYIAQCIRHIKRQLKRAWPLALEGQLQEKIFVQGSVFGQQSLKAKESYRFGEIQNLWLANHILSPQAGEVSALDVAASVEREILGGQPTVSSRAESDADF